MPENVIAVPGAGAWRADYICPTVANIRLEPRHVFIPQKARNTHRRRGLAGAFDADPDRAAAFRQRPRAQGPVSRWAGDGDVRVWLLLGRRAEILGARRRRLRHRGWLCWRADTESDLRRSLFRPHRPQRGGAGGL